MLTEKQFEAIASQLMQSAIPTFERRINDHLDEIKKMVEFTLEKDERQ
jgi:hypothetical protein